MKACRAIKNKAFIFTALAIILLCVPSVHAKSQKKAQKPASVNVRTVQKESADGVKTFSTIQEAINSITDASASNRYVVKIMPGAYEESVIMKEHVDIEGSGQDNTIIDSSSPVTLTSANNTRIKNMKIINTAPDAEGSESTAILFNGVTAKADSLSVESRGTARRSLIRITVSSNVELNNVNALSENSSPDKDNRGIAVRGRAVISNLRAVVSGGSWATAVAVEHGGEIDMRNSSIEASDAAYTDAVDVCCTNNKVIIKGSKITAANGIGDTIGVYFNKNNKNILMTNSEIRARSSAGNIVGVMGGTIKDSIIEGGVSGSNLTNCLDEKNKPIAVSKPKKSSKK